MKESIQLNIPRTLSDKSGLLSSSWINLAFKFLALFKAVNVFVAKTSAIATITFGIPPHFEISSSTSPEDALRIKTDSGFLRCTYI